MRRFFALLLLAACEGASEPDAPALDARVDEPAVPRDAAAPDASSDGGTGMRIPHALETARVWIPAHERYVNEPTLIRADDGTWHVFSNGAEGKGNPWVELQLLHATAPALRGPWTDQPDILSTRDADAIEGALHAPYVMRHGAGYKIFYFDSTMEEGKGLRSASSSDLYTWKRDPGSYPGGRDPMILAHRGTNYLYTTSTELEADESHDIVHLQSAPDLMGWTTLAPALRNPEPCPGSCWGWLESPFVFARAGGFYLFTTFTSSDFETYERTWVLFSEDPTHFEAEPITTLLAHGGEVHEEDGTLYLTHGGWPEKLASRQPGLYVTRLAW
ncbi:MAG: family 43 glycosylhydrolase [Polyangiales bacterium]